MIPVTSVCRITVQKAQRAILVIESEGIPVSSPFVIPVLNRDNHPFGSDKAASHSSKTGNGSLGIIHGFFKRGLRIFILRTARQ